MHKSYLTPIPLTSLTKWSGKTSLANGVRFFRQMKQARLKKSNMLAIFSRLVSTLGSPPWRFWCRMEWNTTLCTLPVSTMFTQIASLNKSQNNRTSWLKAEFPYLLKAALLDFLDVELKNSKTMNFDMTWRHGCCWTMRSVPGDILTQISRLSWPKSKFWCDKSMTIVALFSLNFCIFLWNLEKQH